MRKLLSSILILITATAICHTYSELDSSTLIESTELKKEIISAESIEVTSRNA